MRVKVSKEVDLNKPVNLIELKPVDRIIYSSLDAFHRTKFYKRRVAQTVEKEEEQKRKIREKLLDSLLLLTHQQLSKNKSLADKNDVCDAMLISVSKTYVPFIDEVIKSKDLSAYRIEHITPSSDVRRYDMVLPHLLYIEQRGDDI